MGDRGPRLFLVLPFAAFLVGCGAGAHRAATGSAQVRQPRPVAHVGTRLCHADVSRPLGSRGVAVTAVVRRSARAYQLPGRRFFATFGRLNQNGYPTVFRVLAALRTRGCRASWYRVQLPLRPNGVTGYVRARAVTVGLVRTRILVDVSARRLTLFRDGRPILRTTVAVGSPATPTPTGRYYVNQKLIPADTSGPFGPGALGISAFSNVLTGWAQGGPIGIHGTNEPFSIGHAVSNGCIRLRNRVLWRLFVATPAGTPVVIKS